MVCAMRWTARAQDRFRSLTAFTAGFLLVCFVATAHAGVRINPTSARYASTTAAGVRTTTTFEATLTGTANGVRNYTVPVPVSSSTLGGLARSAMKRIGPAAALYQTAKTIVDGAGWAIDELTDQVLDGPPVPAETIPPGGTYWVDGYNGQSYFTTSEAAARKTVDLYSTACNGSSGACVSMRLGSFVSQIGTAATYQLITVYPTVEVTVNISVSRKINTTSSSLPTSYTRPSPVSDNDFGQLLKNHPEVINAILIDPETGAPIHTPELVQAMNDLRKSIEAANAIDPGPDATPKDPMETQPMESAWPTFCSWASTVCDFINWVKTDDPDTARPEVPWEEEDPATVTQSWSSGLGGGSCPAPVTFSVTLAGTTASPDFSFEPVCQFGTVMRPVIIALAAIIAGFIIAGVRGTKDA